MTLGRMRATVFVLFLCVPLLPLFAQNNTFFTQGNVVVAVEGCGVHGGTCTNVPNGTGNGAGNSSVGGYGDNQAAPLTLFQYTPNGTSSASFVNSVQLPQANSGANFFVSGEYGSSSEATLQLSGGGQYLTIMGYGIDALDFNANPGTYSSPNTNTALGQSGSLTGQGYTAVPRVMALIDANGNVNSSTALYNIFNANNPRSAYTLNGSTAYVSGQGTSGDKTGGVFYTSVGAINNSATAITGADTSGMTANQDTRTVQILNNTLYVSVDSKEGSGSNRDFIGTLGTPPATGLFNSGAGPTQLSNFATSGAGKETITSGAGSNGNNLNAGQKINISPVNYFFASASVLYVADSGFPKNDSNGDTNSTGTANIGDGGLQKWVNSKSDGSGTWSLVYTLYQGLNIVNNGGTTGTTGLYGLAGVVSGNNVLLYATNYAISDLDHTYLYGITDTLSNTTPPGTSLAFTQLDEAPQDSNFKGVSFVPTIPAGDVEVTSSPSGLSFTSAGTGCAPASYATPITLAWTPGSNCTLSVTTPQSGGTGVQYIFFQWEDGTTSTTHVVTAPATTATYTATFTTQYQLTTVAGGGGSVTPGGYFNAGSNATVTATPNSGYVFVNFTGTTNSSSNPLVLTMNSPQSITANFSLIGITSPAGGTTLQGSSATFDWNAYPNATAYWLDIGKEPGGNEYEQSGSLSSSTTSLTVNSLPSDGSTVYATWYYLLNASWHSVAYTYIAFGGSGSKGMITSPTPGSMLSGTSVPFTWSLGSGATAYWIDAGNVAGGNQYFQSGNLGNVSGTTVSNLPTDGSTVYVTLYSLVSGQWLSNAYTYSAYSLSAAAGTLTTPNPGSTLTSGTVTFQWTAGAGASAYWLDVGNVAGGNQYYQSGNLGNVTSTTVSGLPTDGSTIYVTLYSLIGSQWVGNQYSYTALNASGGLAAITSPGNGSTLSGNSVTFTWSTDPNATAYWLDIGTAPGGNTIYQSGNLGNVNNTTVNSLPADGSTIYATLYSFVGGQWLSTSSSYVSGP